MKKIPTLRDVAARAQVSTAVVSYVLNDGPRNVSPKLKERVQKAISELGYRRNSLASALMTGRSNLVGLLVPDTSNTFFGEMAREIEQEARSRNLLMMLGNTSHDAAIEGEYETSLSTLRARAIFVSSASESAGPLDDVLRIFVHSAPESGDARAIVFDDYGGGQMAARHLLSRGFENVHCLAGHFDFGPFAHRRAGWRSVMLEAGRSVTGKTHKIADNRLEAVAQIRALLSSENRPDAIFTTSDAQALCVLQAARELSVAVPGQLGLVGFDGIEEALQGSPKLTTISVSLRELAKEAFRHMDGAPKEHRKTLPVTLTPGDTCGAF